MFRKQDRDPFLFVAMWMFVALLQEISTSRICWLLGHGASLAVKRGMGSTGGKDWYFWSLKFSKQKNGSYEVHPGILEMNILNPKSRWMEDVLQPFVFGIASFQVETQR